MKIYKITMYYVNGTYSYEQTTDETFEEMVSKYNEALQRNTIQVTGQEDKKFIVNTKNIIIIQIEEVD